MAIQKIIRVGNSDAAVLPKHLMEENGFTTGQEIQLISLPDGNGIVITPKGQNPKFSDITPEFTSWLKEFNTKYKKALTELAKK